MPTGRVKPKLSFCPYPRAWLSAAPASTEHIQAEAGVGMDLKDAAGMSRDARDPRGMCLARPGSDFQPIPSSQTRMILK